MKKRKVLVIYNNKLRQGEIEVIRKPLDRVVVWLSANVNEEYPLNHVILLPEDEGTHNEFLKAIFDRFVENRF